MMGRVRRIGSKAVWLWLIAIAAIAMGSGCRRRTTDELAQMAEQETKPLPTLSLTDDTPDLLLTWLDSRGDAHVASKPADVPPEGRDHVRVVVTTKEEGTRGLFYVANLNAKNPDGSYVVSSMPRTEWDTMIAQRRQALAASSAAENAPDQPLPGNGKDPAHPSPSFTVIVYGASWCGACHQAIAYLKSRKIPAIEKDIERDPAAESEMQAKLARAGMHGGSIPVIDVKGNILIGFEPNALEAAVRRATAAVTL